MTLEQLTSAVYNNVIDGLKGTSANTSFSLQHVEDSIVAERLLLIKEYALKNILPKRELLISINCISLDCYPIDKCPSSLCGITGSTNLLHFEIPPIIHDYGDDAIEYIGSKDKMNPFKVYLSKDFILHKFRARGADRPFVWIDTTPNSMGKNDGYVFNATMMKSLSITYIPKDTRLITEYDCCTNYEDYDYGVLSAELEKRVTEKFIRYYRQMAYPITQPNDLTIK